MFQTFLRRAGIGLLMELSDFGLSHAVELLMRRGNKHKGVCVGYREYCFMVRFCT